MRLASSMRSSLCLSILSFIKSSISASSGYVGESRFSSGPSPPLFGISLFNAAVSTVFGTKISSHLDLRSNDSHRTAGGISAICIAFCGGVVGCSVDAGDIDDAGLSGGGGGDFDGPGAPDSADGGGGADGGAGGAADGGAGGGAVGGLLMSVSGGNST